MPKSFSCAAKSFSCVYNVCIAQQRDTHRREFSSNYLTLSYQMCTIINYETKWIRRKREAKPYQEREREREKLHLREVKIWIIIWKFFCEDGETFTWKSNDAKKLINTYQQLRKTLINSFLLEGVFLPADSCCAMEKAEQSERRKKEEEETRTILK